MSDKVNCLEVARNLRLCAGAEWYETRIKELKKQVDVAYMKGRNDQLDYDSKKIAKLQRQQALNGEDDG